MKLIALSTRKRLLVAVVLAASVLALILLAAFTNQVESKPGRVSPGKAKADWAATPPASFNGKILHWTTQYYDYLRSSKNADNGKWVSGKIWVKVGQDGFPEQYQAHYISANGTFNQAILQDRQTWTFIQGASTIPPTSANLPPGLPYMGSKLCDIENTDISDDLDRQRIGVPNFVNVDLLKGLNFRSEKAAFLDNPPPALTKAVVGATPLETYDNQAKQSYWAQEEVRENDTIIYKIAVDPKGRKISSQTKRVSTDGQLIGEVMINYGTLHVYEPNKLLASPFVTSKQAQKEWCGAK